jgi:oligopeptide transport system permease protein
MSSTPTSTPASATARPGPAGEGVAPPVEPALARSGRGRGRPPASLWRDAWQRLRRNRAAVVSLAFVAALLLAAVLAGVLAPYPFQRQDLDHVDEGSSLQHWLGTDDLGRDQWSRLLYGARISMAVAFVDVLIILAIGVPLGLMAGYFGGWIDSLIMRAVDIFYALPGLLLIILVMTSLRALVDGAQTGPLAAVAAADRAVGGLLGVFIALGLVSWLTVARLVRAQVLSLKQKEFVEAARALGAGDRRLIWTHLLPNTTAPILIAATLSMPLAIATEAGLSFLGLGVRPPLPSWGIMIAEGVRSMRVFPHLLLFPGLALALTLVAFTFVGDGLRDALDPQMKT